MDKKKLMNYNPKLAINAFPSVNDEIDNSLPVMSRELYKKTIAKNESKEENYRHNPNYVFSNCGKIPTYLKTKAEMAKCISLDELERL